MNFFLNKINNVFTSGDTLSLNNFSFSNGVSFPKSYIDFVENYGYGLAANLFIIYIPMDNYPDSFSVRSKEIISTYEDVLCDEKELWFDLEPDIIYRQLKNLIPFAMSENGEYLFWDIDKEKSSTELDIYITDFRGLGFTKVAENLYEFFHKVTSENGFQEVLPFSQKPLPKVFKGNKFPIKII
jgi:hypothetical protein